MRIGSRADKHTSNGDVELFKPKRMRVANVVMH
jgi:hypothetical protein